MSQVIESKPIYQLKIDKDRIANLNEEALKFIEGLQDNGNETIESFQITIVNVISELYVGKTDSGMSDEKFDNLLCNLTYMNSFLETLKKELK